MEFPSFDWYELAENEIYLRHRGSGDWGGFGWNAAWVEIKDAYRVMGKHSRQILRLANVIFICLFIHCLFSYLMTYRVSRGF